MIHGHTPFKGATEMLTYLNICEGKIKFKSDLDEDVKNFILCCLKINPQERIGYQKGSDLAHYESIKEHKFFEGIDFLNLDATQVKGLFYFKEKLVSKSFTGRKPEVGFSRCQLRMGRYPKNSDAYSTMDSSTTPRFAISCKEIREMYFTEKGEDFEKRISWSDEDNVPTLFDETQFLGKESSSVVTNLEEDDEIKVQEEEEKKICYYEEPYCKRTLKDIKEDPEEYQNFEGSSSIHSGCFRRLISDDYTKRASDFTKFSKEDESGTSSSQEHRNTTVVLKSSQIHKKGIFFFNERTLTLESSKKRNSFGSSLSLYYISKGTKKEIDLNVTTAVRQVTGVKFEITNYYPTTKYIFRTKTEDECESWILTIKKAIQQLVSE